MSFHLSFISAFHYPPYRFRSLQKPKPTSTKKKTPVKKATPAKKAKPASAKKAVPKTSSGKKSSPSSAKKPSPSSAKKPSPSSAKKSTPAKKVSPAKKLKAAAKKVIVNKRVKDMRSNMAKVKHESMRSAPRRSTRDGVKKGHYNEKRLADLVWKGTGSVSDPIQFT